MLYLFLVAVVVRVLIHVVFANDLILGSDQIDYVNMGRKFSSGDLGGVLNTYWPPLLPALIGFVSLFVDDLTLPAVVVAVLTGSLVAPATYLLVRQSYDHSAALIAGVLAVFFPHLLNAVFDVGSENVYIVLITGSLIAGWNVLSSDSLKYCIVAGVLLGLAYLTRPEAFAYPAFFVSLILLKAWWNKASLRPAVLSSALLLLTFSAVATPYLLYLRAETGSWTISDKTEINTVMGEYSQVIGRNPAAEASEPNFDVATTILLLKIFGFNLVQIHKIIPILVPLPLMVFVAIGLFSTGWSRGRMAREIYLLTFCLLTVIGYAAAVIQTRYFYILLPVVFGWGAKGIVAFGSWLRQTARGIDNRFLNSFATSSFLPASCVALVLLYTLPLNFFMSSHETAWRDRPYEERAAGVWLRDNAGPKSIVFSARKVAAFYGEAVQVPPPSNDFEEVFESIRSGNVEYVVSGQREFRRNPFLKDLESRMESSEVFERVYTNTEHPDYRISIFKRNRVQTGHE